MVKKESERRNLELTSDSDGDMGRNEGGDSDDVIYVDLTEDPESQDWLAEPTQRKKKFSERSEKEQKQLKERFSEKLEQLKD